MNARTAAPLYGLVLAGGRSSRMKRDKAALAYHGRGQLAVAFERLATRVDRCYVSVRADQTNDPTRRELPQIVDRQADMGPIAGITAAQQAAPQAAWLVLACDLPFLGDAVLDALIDGRDPARPATAFRSSHDGLPEPLCAIYEPSSAASIAAYVAGGRQCPRKFLINSDTRLLDLPDPAALDNVNSTDEYWNAMQKLNPTEDTSRRIEVQYFAILREQAGRSRESLQTSARTPRELYAELQQRHPFSLQPDMLRVAINEEFGDWSQPLAAGDNVVFIPPVAGG
jgi:molybdopterin-guanine dinucleotide biosynthesis protein A